MEEIKLGKIIYFTSIVTSDIHNFCTHHPPEQAFLQMYTLSGVSSVRPLPTEKVHWIINSKYVRWRSVPFPFVHSNVVAFSYNFGCKYNFFFLYVYLALAFSLFPHLLETIRHGLRRDSREKKKKSNCERLCKCEQQSSPKCRSY